MNPESLLFTVALNHVKFFLNTNASKHPCRQKNAFTSNYLIVVREVHYHSQKVMLQLVHRFHKSFVHEFISRASEVSLN